MFSFFWLSLLWVREAFVGFFRNFGWNIAALFLAIFCLLGFSVSFVAGENAKFFAEELGDKLEIQVELAENVEKSEHVGIKERMLGLSQVKEVRYVSEEETFEKVKVDMGDDADILEVLDTNPFPAKFIIKLHEPDQVENVVQQVETWGISTNIQYGEGYIERLLNITEMISKVGYLITAIVALATIYIVSSVIKFNVDQRKEEIKIKQLTGTGMFTIRFPFVLEAMMITGISSIIVYASFYFGYESAMDYLKEMIPYIPIVDPAYIVDSIMRWLLALALSIGLIGSLMSTSRNLKKI